MRILATVIRLWNSAVFRLSAFYCGGFPKIYPFTVIKYPSRIKVGGGFELNEFCVINGFGTIWIGKNVKIGFGSKIFTFDYDLKNRRIKRTGGVVIGDNVWIGANSVITKGVVIGDNVTIGAGSIVTKNIPANQVWAGNPAKQIR